jgi:hypothetical protein
MTEPFASQSELSLPSFRLTFFFASIELLGAPFSRRLAFTLHLGKTVKVESGAPGTT